MSRFGWRLKLMPRLAHEWGELLRIEREEAATRAAAALAPIEPGGPITLLDLPPMKPTARQRASRKGLAEELKRLWGIPGDLEAVAEALFDTSTPEADRNLLLRRVTDIRSLANGSLPTCGTIPIALIDEWAWEEKAHVRPEDEE